MSSFAERCPTDEAAAIVGACVRNWLEFTLEAMATAQRSTAFKKVAELAKAATPKHIELAEALWKLKRADPDGFKDIIATGTIKQRPAYQLATVWGRLRTLKIRPKELDRVGWAKMTEIVRYCGTAQEVRDAINLADRRTVADLRAKLREGSDPPERQRVILLRFSEPQYRRLRAALTQNGAKLAKNGKGLVGQEQAILEIVKIATKKRA